MPLSKWWSIKPEWNVITLVGDVLVFNCLILKIVVLLCITVHTVSYCISLELCFRMVLLH